jgi:anhydro-N-acetylmuramic acid kinase
LQICNPAPLAKLTGISVVAVFPQPRHRRRGQAAPLAPAFHAAVFGSAAKHRVIVNIGGIANLTDLPERRAVTGFDTGLGNVLLDLWIDRHLGQVHDDAAAWARSGSVLGGPLAAMLAEPYFAARPPKSCGRDLFNAAWLEKFSLRQAAPQDVQDTLAELSARSIADAVDQYCPQADEIHVCGGAYNLCVLKRLRLSLPQCHIATTAALGE